MSAQTPVPNDHPLMVAWNAYKATFDYENTKHWATSPDHTEGSLWAAFLAGFTAKQPVPSGTQDEREREIRESYTGGSPEALAIQFLLAQLDEARQHPFMLHGARAFLARVASRLSESPNTWSGIWQDAGARDACGIVRGKIFELAEAERVLKEGK